jgi:hypothetical protein
MIRVKRSSPHHRTWAAWAATGATVYRNALTAFLCAFAVAISATPLPSAAAASAQTSAAAAPAPRPADVESFRKTIEPIFMRDRGGTMPGYAACVMCHTWQTNLRFDLETPETDAGWTAAQSRLNFQMITRLVNTRSPETRRRVLEVPRGSRVPDGPVVDQESARGPLRSSAGAARRLRVLPLVRAERLRETAGRTH